VAVNITSRELRSESFLADIFSILEVTGIDPRSLELEMTESVLMKDATSTETILGRLREKGMQVAVDDFGTGYSSMRSLRDFKINTLKISESFVRQITTLPSETSLVTAAIRVAQSLNVRVLAEGVENHGELAFLRSQQCDEAQGNYFSRPVPPQEFAKLLETGIARTLLLPFGETIVQHPR
jgi:EAL domain-containing protein (putative c-di-GMP-specific phosphodiesterase class I)